MPISIENGLSVGIFQALATLMLVSTYIYLEKAADDKYILFEAKLEARFTKVTTPSNYREGC